jgi:integrase
MASLFQLPGKRGPAWVVMFYDAGKRRKKIRIGKATDKTAAAVKQRIEALVAAKLAGTGIDGHTAAWVKGISPALRKRLLTAGLIEPSKAERVAERPTITLRAFLDTYTAGRTDVKRHTQLNYKQAVENLLTYFGDDKPLDAITEGDAEEYQRWLTGKRGLGDNTSRRHCGRAKQFFAFALRKEFIRRNPFAGLKDCRVRENRERDHFVSRDVAYAVLEACPDTEWRLLFALCRFGGLRCPSEILALRWADVDWERDRMVITSPKTEHIEGKESRVVPIFAELRPYLDDAYEQAQEGAVFVIGRYRDSNANLRTQLSRIVRRAGVKAWGKLFHNLRATRETELAAEFPLHVVCEWIGNSEQVATRHYLRVTEADMKRAAEKRERKEERNSFASCTQDLASGDRPLSQIETIPSLATPCDLVQTCPLPPRGLEPLSSG